MSTIRKNARLVLLAFAVAIALPTFLTLTASAGEAGGWLIATGIKEPVCNSGGSDDCPGDV